MAIIKCPECGRQISDKAPVCPNCGVEIAGKIIKCPQCGEVYFKNQQVCPNCHHLTYAPEHHAQPTIVSQSEKTAERHEPEMPTVVPPVPPVAGSNEKQQEPSQPAPKRHYTALIVSLCIALVVCGVCFYFYNNAKTSKEQEAYEFAMKSDDPLVLQTYLDNNLDAPEAHRDSIMAHLDALKKQDSEWANAVASGSKGALQDYLARHPESEHVAEAKHKIDSLDWLEATNENTLEAMQLYMDQHADGEHIDEATDNIKTIKAKTVQPEEKTLVQSILRRFFQSINAKSEDELQATVSPILTNFLGKQDATKADVVTFMNKIYKEDITNMNWHLNGDYKINKKEVGDERYEYSVAFSAQQKVERNSADQPQEVRYQIKATVNPDGLISSMSMTKILE
jgi:RNA polymerase subunit RPABC4/transcription elongation factor Spt4/chromatin remodeling complex protein RSC6